MAFQERDNERRRAVTREGKESEFARRLGGFIANKIANDSGGSLSDALGACPEAAYTPWGVVRERWSIRGSPCQPNAQALSDHQTFPCRYLDRVPTPAFRYSAPSAS